MMSPSPSNNGQSDRVQMIKALNKPKVGNTPA